MFDTKMTAKRFTSFITLGAYLGVHAILPAFAYAAAPAAITSEASLDFYGGTRDGGGTAGGGGYFVSGGNLSLSNGVLKNFVTKGGEGSG
ncbi:MAG: hypothetical protein DVB28_000138, partial [Verrucomicrobia bacterium]